MAQALPFLQIDKHSILLATLAAAAAAWHSGSNQCTTSTRQEACQLLFQSWSPECYNDGRHLCQARSVTASERMICVRVSNITSALLVSCGPQILWAVLLLRLPSWAVLPRNKILWWLKRQEPHRYHLAKKHGILTRSLRAIISEYVMPLGYLWKSARARPLNLLCNRILGSQVPGRAIFR